MSHKGACATSLNMSNIEIYRIRLNSNKYQSFLPFDQNIWSTDALKMDGRPKLPDWKSPKIYIHNPKHQRGDFFHFCSGAFVIDSIVAKKMLTFFENAGELLPLTFEQYSYFIFNVLECVNCLDLQKTEWVIGKATGEKIRIKKYAFDKNRLAESTLFKIPETAAAEILCASGLKDPEDEFKFQVEAAGLTGLIFEKVWSESN